MSIYIWSSEPSKIYVWSNEVSAVYVWTTKVRPDKMPWYQEVEYIESSGTQYIDTGYVLTSNPWCDIDFSFLWWDSNSRIPIYWSRNGGYYWDNTGNFCLYINSSSLYVTPNYAWFDPWTSSWVTISKNTKYNIIENAGKFYLNWDYKSSASTTNTYVSSISRTFLLFGNNDYTWSVQIRWCSMRLYWCKLYNNNVLVREFVPCYRKSDSVIWLYDLVNNQFYTNAWTGTFTKWWNVN